MKVLVIDDLIINVILIEEILNVNDIEVISAEDGTSGLEKAKEEGVALILLDINMPDLDGYEVCKRLKSMDETRDISVIFVTSYTDKDSLERGFAVGADDYLTKPLNEYEIRAKANVHLKKHKLFEELNNEIAKRNTVEKELKEANDQYIAQNEELLQYVEQLDITTRNLENSENKLKTIIENSIDAIFLMKNDHVIDCNISALKLFKLDDKSDFENRNQIGFSPEYQPGGALSYKRAKEHMSNALKNGNVHFEWLHFDSSGKEFYVDTTYTSIILEEEKYIFAVLRNITHRKMIERALIRSEKRFREMFEFAPLAYHTLNSKGVVIDINNEWLSLTLYERKNIIGHRFTDFLAEKDKALFTDNFTELTKNSKGLELSLHLYNKEKQLLSIKFSGRVQFAPNGSFVCIHCFIYDSKKEFNTGQNP